MNENDSINQFINYGFYQKSSNSNEDRYFISLNHKNEGFNNIASFGVFDGHNGSRSAQFCSDNVHKLILKSFHNLLFKYQDHELINNHEFLDGLLCQAINEICISTDSYLKEITRSGCTLNSLFLIYNPLDQTINIYNANIGDSRCVMINYNQKYINTSTSSTFINSSNSLNQIAPMNKVHFEKDISDSKHSVSTYIASSIDSIDQSFHNITSSITSKSVKIKREVTCTALSDDHNLMLLRERSRLVNRSTIYSDVLPNYIDSYTGVSIYHSSDTENSLNQLFDNEINIESTEQKSNNFTSLLGSNIVNYSSDDESELSNQPVKSAKNDKINQSIRLVREESFITNRKGIDGSVGPEAIFSRYNVSIMMTRSLGDRYGPRSCVGIPDIKSLTIPSNQFTRLIIASDGLFDVITNNQIKLSALKSKYKDPNVYAKHLVNKAIRYRNNQGLRLDDITVLCVDIHSNHYKCINNTNGIDIYKFKNNLMVDMNDISNDNNIVIDNSCAPGCTMQ